MNIASDSQPGNQPTRDTSPSREISYPQQLTPLLPTWKELRGFQFSVDSRHVTTYRHLVCLLSERYAQNDPLLPALEQLNACFKGVGVYIGPESRSVLCGPSILPLSHVLQIRDDLLSLSQRMFPGATKLTVLGPELALPPYLDATQNSFPELDVYRGLDRNWPKELTAMRPSWAVCLHLWDPSYYLSICTPTSEFESAYAAMASALHSNMAEKAAILTSTLMRPGPDLAMFVRGVERAGWRVVHLSPADGDLLLLLKGM